MEHEINDKVLEATRRRIKAAGNVVIGKKKAVWKGW